MTGVEATAVWLLVFAGLPKLADPRGSQQALVAARLPGSLTLLRRAWTGRLLGGAELVVAGLAVATGRIGSGVLCLTYLVLALFAWRLLAVGRGADCGCFGSSSSPASVWHVAVNVALSAGCALMIWQSDAPFWRRVTGELWWGAPLVAASAVLAYACVLLMTAFSDLQLALGQREAA